MSKFKFSVGPWNVHTGADSYGPATEDIPAEEKYKNSQKWDFPQSSFMMMMQFPTSTIILWKRSKKSKRSQKNTG